MFGATTSACIEPSRRKQTISLTRGRSLRLALLTHAIWPDEGALTELPCAMWPMPLLHELNS